MIEKIILKKSSVLDKMPAPEQLEYGEIAINYNAEHPFLSFKDSDGDIMPLNDYSQDIAYLYSHKLDAGVLDVINENSDNIKKKLNITDFNAFKADNAKTINALDKNVSQNGSEIQEVNGVVQNHTTAISTLNTSIEQKADKTELKKYAKKSDMTQYIEAQTIYATELNADDLILADISLNDTLNTLNTNVADKINKTDITQSTGTSETAVMSQKAVSLALSNVYTKAESDARYLRGDWELISEVSEYDTSKNKITVAENCDGYKELAVRRTNNNTLSNTNVYLDVNGYSISLQGLSSQKKDAVWHVVQDGNNLSVKFLSYNFVNTGRRFYYASSTNEYYINCKIGGKVELNFYNLTTLHDGENIKVYGKR